MSSEKRRIGDICERIAVKHLVKHSFELLDRNYRRKWGELDIVAKNCDILHFIEVKGAGVKSSAFNIRPEENLHHWKQKRLYRAIQTWLMDHPECDELDWQVDIMAVFLDLAAKKAKIRWTKNIILE